eukprot:scaffold303781_cov96-Cyclotella_meneghiniana.AAC.4
MAISHQFSQFSAVDFPTSKKHSKLIFRHLQMMLPTSNMGINMIDVHNLGCEVGGIIVSCCYEKYYSHNRFTATSSADVFGENVTTSSENVPTL